MPAFFAAPLALAGLAARRESWRKHAMHAALVMALLGAGEALSRAVPAGELRLASISQLLMGVGLLVCLALRARSFILARREFYRPGRLAYRDRFSGRAGVEFVSRWRLFIAKINTDFFASA